MPHTRNHLLVLPALVIAFMASGFSLEGAAAGKSGTVSLKRTQTLQFESLVIQVPPRIVEKTDLLLPRKS